MKLRLNKGFSLFEVIIAVAILSTSLVFVFRAFTTVLSALRLSRDISAACWFAENSIWDASIRGQGISGTDSRGYNSTFDGVEFISRVSQSPVVIDTVPLRYFQCDVSWKEARKREENLTVFTHLAPQS